jgi:hypothetical protein
MTHNYYVYIYCDPRKKGEFKFAGIDYVFNHEPFYVGMGKGYRFRRHTTNFEIDWNYNTIKNGKIKHIIDLGLDPLKYVNFFKENISKEEACLVEQELIAKLGRINNQTGILSNMTDGGDGWSGAISKNKGKTYEEIYGNKKAKELKEKKRKNLLGNTYGSHNKGKKMSDESKKHLSKLKSIPVKQLDKNMNLIKIWETCQLAADFLKISVSGIHNTLNEKMPAKSAGGYYWEFTTKINNKYRK